MDERRNSTDRRHEERTPIAGRVAWRRLISNTEYRGWLSDRTAESISFIAGDAVTPFVGEVIELLRRHRPPQRVRVTRLAPYDDRLSLVAACSVT